MKGWNGASRREFDPTLDSDPDMVALRGKSRPPMKCLSSIHLTAACVGASPFLRQVDSFSWHPGKYQEWPTKSLSNGWNFKGDAALLPRSGGNPSRWPSIWSLTVKPDPRGARTIWPTR